MNKELDVLSELEELKKYRKIGALEELEKREKEEDILKFYYCESEDSYLIGMRIGTMYFAHWNEERKSFTFDMSRYLPWGEHIVSPTTAWKEHTYPSKPKEMDFTTWLNGFIDKYIS